MSNETDNMNYCCDCGWAVKKGLFFKRWYCTNPQKNEGFGSHVCHPVTGKPLIKTPIACDVARFVEKGEAVEQHAVNLKHPCPNYKGELRGHPAIPPPATPYYEAPPKPERVVRTTQEHDAEYLMNQKQRELEAENRLLKEAKEELLKQLKMACKNYCGEHIFCGTLKRSIYVTIQKYNGKDGEK